MVSPLISALAAARRRRGGAAIVASIYPPHTGITTFREPDNTVSSEEGSFQVVVDMATRRGPAMRLHDMAM